MKKWKKISSEMALDAKWFRVRKDTVELPNGKILDDYFLWLSGDVSLVVPITEEGKFVLVKQYKYGANEEMVEFPAGFVDKNENPEDAAKRELEEETGYIAKEFALLAKNKISPTKSDGDIYIYLAKNAKKEKETNSDISEDIEILVKSREEVMNLIVENKIKVSDSIAAFFLALRKIES